MKDAFFSKLKRINISKDGEKTKTRINELWKNSTKAGRHDLITATGHGIYKMLKLMSESGHITAKSVILFSRHLDADPFYLTGETDERGNYTDELLKSFLVKSGYESLWREYVKYNKNTDDRAKSGDKGDKTEYMTDKFIGTPELSDGEAQETAQQFDAYDKYKEEHKNDIILNLTPVDRKEALNLTNEYNITPPPAEPSINIGNNRHLMVSRLSRKNVSKDGEKTKQRVAEIWDSAPKRDKIRAKNLASNIHATIKNIAETSNISERTAIVLAHAMNVSPFYLTGEADEYGNCDEDILKVFLMKSGSKDILEQTVKSETDNYDNDEILVDVADEPDKGEANPHTNKSTDIPDNSDEIQSIADNLTEEEVITLMRALLIRSKIKNPDITAVSKKVKLLLLLN